jgi:restriction system protein
MKHSFFDQYKIRETKEYGANNKIIYVAEISHSGLGTHKIFRAYNEYVLNNKVDSQITIWENQWIKMVKKEETLTSATELTDDAQNKLREIENILRNSLTISNTIKWNSLKDKSKFDLPIPAEIPQPPPKPDRSNFEPVFNIFDKIFKSLREEKIYDVDLEYRIAIRKWKEKDEVYQVELKNYEQLVFEWEKQKAEFLTLQDEYNRTIDTLELAYSSKDQNAVVEYCNLVLLNSDYPETFPKNFEINYNIDTKLLIIDYALPEPKDFPTLVEVKYIAAKDEFKESHLTESQLSKIYDNAIYNITLRTLHEIFESDQINAIESIIFNGWVETIKKTTGKMVNSCIVSIQAKKSEFIELNLEYVDPKACFKGLKGIGSSTLIGLTAVQPIAQINKNDKRFVSSKDVFDQLSDIVNLAIMDWQEFEQLIREIFEEEFLSTGGEVKVTQASRDGGVDAVAFDPDPIRGGKIVIQAKRYTNTVGVSAVRDLYGTVLNEGATKGILVTTTDYGSDAYEFAKNKPLTLLNGSNLLYLLEKHGHKARIDIAEAKKIQTKSTPKSQ